MRGGTEETGLEPAGRGHLLPIQVKPQEIPRASGGPLGFPINPRGNYPVCRQAGSSGLAGCQGVAPRLPPTSPPPTHPPSAVSGSQTSRVRAGMETEGCSLLAWGPCT